MSVNLFEPPYLFWTVTAIVFVALALAAFAAGIILHLRNRKSQRGLLVIYTTAVLAIAFFTRFFFFNYPFNTFWDENYHVASAQKYIGHVFFMEPHPPLGKMVIALGEVLFHPNDAIDTTSFLSTDYIQNFPANYSFFGVRFFPTLLSALSCVLFFFILFVLSGNPHYSFLFSAFYLFENGMIIHTRSAMLEGTQIFFILLAILYFVILFKKENIKIKEYLFLGLLVGLSLAVKLNSLIMVLLLAALLLKEYWPGIKAIPIKLDGLRNFADSLKALRFDWKVIFQAVFKSVAWAAGAWVVFLLFYYIHIAIGDHAQDSRFYQASPEYQQILQKHESANPLNFPKLYLEHLAFVSHYEKGVPVWDPTKADENGSPAFAWPFGYKTINYRWESAKAQVAYFYFVGNPFIWYAGLVAFLLAFSLVVSKYVFGLQVTNRKRFNQMLVFGALYVSYMAAVLQLSRVMYLYHYLLPLIFAMILLYVVFLYLFEERIENNDKLLLWGVVVLAVELAAVFIFFSPFTYGMKMDAFEFARRVWTKVWDLRYLYF